MQKILFLLLFCLLSTNTFAQFTSAQQVIDQLIGNWQWTMAQGGFAGETITPVSSGITASYHITQNPTDIGEDSLTVQLYTYTTLITENKVKVVSWNTDGWAISGADLSGGIFGGGSTFYPIITLNNTNLTLNDNIGDGYTYYFEKININITPTTTPTTTCNACDGTIDIAVDGGTAPYAYTWSNGSTTQDQANLCAGTYTLTVTDADGNTATASTVVSCPNCTNPPVVALVPPSGALCNSVSEGNTTFNLNNLLGTSTVGGVWSGVGVSGNTFSGAGLAAGSYVVTYTIAATANCPAASGIRTVFVTDCDPTPIATPDFMPVIPGTSPVTVNVLANDTDNGAIILTSATIDPANGTVSVNGNNVIYTPSGSVTTGSIDITYTIQDNAGQTATGTLTVLISDCLAYAGDIDLIINFIGEDNLPVYCSDALINLSQITPFNSDANFTQVYLVTDTLGNIAQIHNTLPIPAPPAGIWKIAALNYQNDNITGLVVDNNLSDLAGCYNVSYSDKFVALPVIEITYTIEYVGTDQIIHFQFSGGYPAYNGYGDYDVNWPPFVNTYDLDLGYATFDLTFPCDAEGPFNFAIYSDGALCDEFITVNLTPNCPPPININIETIPNNAIITVDGGTPPYTYLWSNGSTTENLNYLCVGTYTVTVTDTNGSTNSASFTSTESSSQPIISDVVVDCSSGSASITIFANTTGGFQFLQYSLGGIAIASNVFNGVANGTYIVSVQSSSGCITTQSVNADCLQILNITPTTTPTSTCNTCDGTIDIAVDGGTAPYAYTWSNGSITQNQTNLCAGTYTVTVTDADGNSTTASTVVNGAITITLGNYSCEDETTANTSITISGGVPPYTVSSTGIYDIATSEPLNFVNYTFDGGTINFATYEGQPWSFTIVDANGCTSTKTGTFDLPNPSLNPISAVSTSTPIFTVYENNYTNTGTNLNGQFFGSSSGMIDNNDGYSGSIDPFTMGPAQHFVAYCTQAQNGGGAGFGEGFYESGCSICAEQTIIVYPSFDGDTGSGDPFVEIGVNNTGSLQADVLLPSTCTTNTNINLSLTYLDDIASWFETLGIAFDPAGQINEMDDYITWSGTGITDNANGTATFAPAALAPVPIDGVATTIQVTVGYPGFETIYTATINVVNPSNIVITPTTTPTSTCNTCDGTIDIAVDGGTAPYAYTWSNSSITQNQTNLCAGTYTLTVTDADGNTATTSTVVSSLNTPVISNISLDCNLGASSITVFATDPNSETLEYALNGSNYQSSSTFTTIPNGNYTVIVRNTTSSCVVAQNFTVDCFPIINITPTTTPTSTCNMCDATIDIDVNGGTAPYAYLWSNGSIAQNQNTLCTGIYTLTVTDANGNTATQSISITNPEVPTISNISIDCNDATTTVTVTASTPNGEPLEYAINGINYQSANGFTTVADGTYPMFVRNTVTGCISVQNFTVSCSALNITAIGTPTISCGACNGGVQVQVNGGTAPYTYLWNTGANFPNMINLCAGTYTLTVTDATGLTGTATAIVNEPTPPVVNLPNITDCSLTSATLDAGSGFSAYFWNTGETTQSIVFTNSGTYTVTVTANNNCTAVSNSTHVIINCNNPSCNYTIIGNNNICQGQSTTLTPIGAALLPFSYQWNTGENTESIIVTTTGIYAVTISDGVGNSCATATTIMVNPTPNVAFFNNCSFGCIDCIGCSDGPYTYNWSNGSTDACINTNLAANYQVTVTNVYGCFTIVDAVVSNNSLAFQSIDVSPACNGNNGSICVNVIGGVAPYSYAITNSIGQSFWADNGLCVSNLLPDTYTLYVTDANSCVVSATATVETQNITVNQQTYSCGQASMTFTAPNNAANYQWSTGETTNTITVTDYTQGYNVTVTGTNGCTSVYGYEVADVPAPIVNLSDALACNGETVTLDAGTEGVTYQWSTGAETSTIDVSNAGWYIVTVTNFTGCTTIDSAFVSVDCNLYPGDANNDGIANYLDLLSIGNHFNQTGAARIDASNNWTPQALSPWGIDATNGMDIGYTDCNGDGTINAADTTAIALNYGNEHQAVIINAPQNFNISLQANPANEGLVTDETAIIPFDVVISNTNNTPLNEIYGIGFKLHYTSPTPASMAVAFKDASSGWMSYLGDASSNNPDNQILTLTRNFITSDTTGELHIALTKVNGQAIEGTLAGICRVIATVTIDTWGLKSLDSSASSPIPVTFNFDGITLTTADGTTYQQGSSVTDTLLIPTIVTGINTPKQATVNWVIYPNPANDYATIFVKDANSNNNASNINIYDVTGRLVLSKPISANQHTLTIPTNTLNSGLYYCWYGNSVQKLLISK